MSPKRWSRKEALTDVPRIELWPRVEASLLSQEDSEIFSKRQEAVKMYLAGIMVKEIEVATGIRATSVAGFVRRCLLLSEDGRILGFRALIPYYRSAEYKRKIPIERKLPEAKGGCAGMLGYVLNTYPDLDEELRSTVLKINKKRKVHEFRIRAVELHREFLEALKKRGHPLSKWPFNTKYRGLRSITTYMQSLLDESFDRAVLVRSEHEAKAHLAVGTGYLPLIRFEYPYAAVELDAHSIQAFFSVAFTTPKGAKVQVLLERLWLIIMVDRVSQAVLAASIVYSSEVTAEDVLNLVRKAVAKKWEPMDLTIPGLQYPSHGGIPSGKIPECHGALFDCLLLDNHLSHLSKSVRELARTSLGFSVNYGPVAHFERRPTVERLFKSIEEALFGRLPSTTGSNPRRGRAPNAEAAAIKYQIDAAEMEQMLDVSIAGINGTPSEGLSFMSPLEYLQFYFEDKESTFMVRRLPNQIRESQNALPERIKCVVRGGKTNGRRPYIQLDRAKYTTPTFTGASHLIGQEILVEIFDEEDFRSVKAYLLSGVEIGILSVQGHWALSKHTRQTRKAINRLIYRRALVVSETSDPVRAYLDYLGSKHQSSKKLTVPSPKDARAMYKVSRESDLPLTIPDQVAKKSTTSSPLVRVAPEDSAIGKPMPDLANILNPKR